MNWSVLKPFVGAALGLLVALPASAMMPPEVYEEARAEAANVIVFSVESVEPPDGNLGHCTVHGIVERVERGTRYRAADPVTIAVDCLGQFDMNTPIGGTIWHNTESLMDSKFGRAFLSESGSLVLYQYEQLNGIPVTKVK